jgi:hypothetical protein
VPDWIRVKQAIVAALPHIGAISGALAVLLAVPVIVFNWLAVNAARDAARAARDQVVAQTLPVLADTGMVSPLAGYSNTFSSFVVPKNMRKNYYMVYATSCASLNDVHCSREYYFTFALKNSGAGIAVVKAVHWTFQEPRFVATGRKGVWHSLPHNRVLLDELDFDLEDEFVAPNQTFIQTMSMEPCESVVDPRRCTPITLKYAAEAIFAVDIYYQDQLGSNRYHTHFQVQLSDRRFQVDPYVWPPVPLVRLQPSDWVYPAVSVSEGWDDDFGHWLESNCDGQPPSKTTRVVGSAGDVTLQKSGGFRYHC